MSRRPGGEHGSATVHALGAGVVLTLVALLALQVALLIGTRHAAASAADLAALAGTQAAAAGQEPCPAAETVAERNGARLLQCRADVEVVTVRVRRVTRTAWGQRVGFESDARAAPVDYELPGG